MAELITVTDADGKTQNIKVYNGHKFPPIVPGNVKDHLDKVKKLKVRPEDVVLLTYPRCGLHWTREIVNMLQRGEATYIDKSVIDTPLEFTDIDVLDKMTSPRPLFSHALFEYLPEDFIERKGKIINVTRNPKDCAVSLHIIMNKFNDGTRLEPTYAGTWSEFLKMFCRGDMPTGGFIEYHRDMERVKKELDYPILVVYYEDLQEDQAREIKRIAEFLEVPYTDKLITDIAEKCKFTNIKQVKSDKMTDFTKQVSVDGSEIFFRKGKFGDWKNWFTVAQNEAFDKWYKEGFKGSSYKHRFTL